MPHAVKKPGAPQAPACEGLLHGHHHRRAGLTALQSPEFPSGTPDFSGYGGDLRPLRGHGAPRGQAFCARAQNLDAGALLVPRSKKAGGPTGTCLWGAAPWPSSPPRWPNWPSKVRSFLQGLRTFSGYGGRSPVPSGPPRHPKGCRGGFLSRSKWTNLFAALPWPFLLLVVVGHHFESRPLYVVSLSLIHI